MFRALFCLASLLCSLLLTTPSSLQAGPVEHEASPYLLMLFSPMNKPPFWFFEADQPRGIIYDLLHEACLEQGVELKAQAAARKRGSAQVLAEEHSVIGRALEWIERPERFAISDPLIGNADILISLRDTPVDFNSHPSELEGMIIGTHLGYVYPTLDPLFSNGLLIRSDSSDELNMIQRVHRQRIPAAVISRPVARWYIRSNHWQSRFYLSEQVLSEVQIRLLFNKTQQPFVEHLNRSLSTMRADGRYQAILDRYL